MTKRRSTLESEIQRTIEVALGAERDLLLLRNSVGKARFVNEEKGEEYFVPYGLGVGSPDLVGILRLRRTIAFSVDVATYGVWFCLEVKVPGEENEEHQAKSHAIWRRFGAFIETVHDVAEAKGALERARKWTSQ